jgi:hypothetical protein
METTRQSQNNLQLGVEMPNSDGFRPSNPAYEVSEVHLNYTPVLEAYNIDIWNIN